ncbi:MAG: Plug domain-containing protein [Longimicrobiales bacterium]|nr:Plug domain-containing protein [Longimicrobiales bacterium]
MEAERSRHRIAVAVLGLAVATTGCGGARTAPGGDPAVSGGYSITSEELAATGASTVWDALRLKVRFATFITDSEGRPNSIRTRGRSSVQRPESMLVYVDRTPLPDIRLLDALPLSRVERVVILRGPDATTFFGTNAGDGVIQIFTRIR